MSKNIKVTTMGNSPCLSIKAQSSPKINFAKKIRVLWYSDFLRHTGFGNVAEEIISRLLKTGKYHFEVLGINYNGEPYNHKNSDYYHFKDVPVWAAYNGGDDNMFGFKKLEHLLHTRQFDILFVLQDSFNMTGIKDMLQNAKQKKLFRHIFYFPIDGDIHRKWINDAVKIADYPIVYTKFGKEQIQKKEPTVNLGIIPHGVDLETFKPFDSEEERNGFRQEYFNIQKNEIIISNINRNQPRKDLPRCIIAFGEFVKKYPQFNAKLYLHCHVNDSAGFKLHEICKKYLTKDTLNRVILPDPDVFGNNGYPVSIVSKIYAASDIVTSTSMGEGWGLCVSEGIACKTPVVMPNNTATTEIIGSNEERGYLVKSGADINAFTILKFDNDIRRPLTDINDLVEKWAHVCNNPEEAKQKAEAGYKWIQNYTWDKIVYGYWDKLFETAYKSL